MVAPWGGVATSSVPPIRSVCTVDVRTLVYSFSVGLAGQACNRPPPPKRNSVAGLPMIEPLPFLLDEK